MNKEKLHQFLEDLYRKVYSLDTGLDALFFECVFKIFEQTYVSKHEDFFRINQRIGNFKADVEKNTKKGFSHRKRAEAYYTMTLVKSFAERFSLSVEQRKVCEMLVYRLAFMIAETQDGYQQNGIKAKEYFEEKYSEIFS
jgi:hypothetical protein